ncbi:MAG: hypothetical protein ACRDN1_21045 [Trebonia sp.]
MVLRTVAMREGLAQRVIDGDEPGLWELRQPETYLHAVATGDGLRLDEHLNELIERPPLARLTGGTALMNALPAAPRNTEFSPGYRGNSRVRIQRRRSGKYLCRRIRRARARRGRGHPDHRGRALCVRRACPGRRSVPPHE